MSRKTPPPRSPYERLEAAMGTLKKERRFFEALMEDNPVAKVVNHIIYLVTFFQGAEQFIPPYLEREAMRLFPTESMNVAAILYGLLCDIAASARLAGYLCVEGIPQQALAVLRGAIEQVGVYTHVWHDPGKYRFVPDSDGDDYSEAFRNCNDQVLKRELKARDVKFRFMYCKGAQPHGASLLYATGRFVGG